MIKKTCPWTGFSIFIELQHDAPLDQAQGERKGGQSVRAVEARSPTMQSGSPFDPAQGNPAACRALSSDWRA